MSSIHPHIQTPELQLHTVWPSTQSVDQLPKAHVDSAEILKAHHPVLAGWPTHSIIGAWRTYSQYVNDETWSHVDPRTVDSLFERFLTDVAHARQRAWHEPVPMRNTDVTSTTVALIKRSQWFSTLTTHPEGLWVLVHESSDIAPELLTHLSEHLGPMLSGPIYRIFGDVSQAPLFTPESSDLGAKDPDKEVDPNDLPCTPGLLAHEALEKASVLDSKALVLDDDLGDVANAKAALLAVNSGRCVITRMHANSTHNAYTYLSDIASCLGSVNQPLLINQLGFLDITTGQCLLWPKQDH